jgi:hypothetical protein
MGLVAPALFMFLLGIGWFGYAFWLQNALDYAVTNAARCASISSACMTGTPPAADSTTTASYAAGASGAGFDPSVFTVTLATTCGGKTGNQVSALYPVTLLIPFVSVSLNLSSQACYPK